MNQPIGARSPSILLVFKKIYSCLFIPNCTRNHVITYTNNIRGKITYTKEIKNAPSAFLSYISTREFLRTLEKCGEARAEGEYFSHFSSVLKKFSSAYQTQQCSRNDFFLFLLYSVLWIAHARTDGVGCVHYISTVHSCDVRRVLYGNIMNSFRPMTARAFLRTFYDKKYLCSEFEYSIRTRLQRYPQLYYILICVIGISINKARNKLPLM